MTSSSALAAGSVIAVVGSGAMGAGIAQVAAAAGHAVRMFDVQPGAADRARAGIVKGLQIDADKGRIREDEVAAIAQRIDACSALAQLSGAVLVVEAIVENLEVKRRLFSELEGIVDADCIVASNTSSLSITALAAGAKRPGRIVGMHFFNPVPRMRLVEIVSGLATDAFVASTLYETARAWGKRPVHARSTPGFIVNRVARPYYAEALRLVQERVADPAIIDRLLRDGGGFRMGPFELMDLIGHDVNYAVTSAVFDAYYQDPRYKPSLVQKELVDAGRLGRKSGRGFYDYGNRDAKAGGASVAVKPLASPGALTFHGDAALFAPLRDTLAASGWRIEIASDHSPYGLWSIAFEDGVLALTDGRSATQVSADTGSPNVVLCDWWRSGESSAVAVASAWQSAPAAIATATELLHAAGVQTMTIADSPALIVLRTVAMLANEAADAVHQGVASAEDVDLAMRDGVNYPMGPLEWAGHIGLPYIQRILANLHQHYEDDRYRCSPLIKQHVWANKAIVA